jgi:hypothetical protein
VHESSPELIRALTTQLDHFRKQLKAILDRHGLQTLPAEALPGTCMCSLVVVWHSGMHPLLLQMCRPLPPKCRSIHTYQHTP